jgi:6,7-dimethyl-8-ribityllumazine synthase
MAEPGLSLGDLSFEQQLRLSSFEFAVCVGRFYEDLAERLLDGARGGFELVGVPATSLTEISVPGAFELPFAAKECATQRRFDEDGTEVSRYAGIACLGVVIRGETDHYDFVCAEAARGVQSVQLETGVPCAFGVITCDTMEQALERAGGGKRDQGRNAALTVAQMSLIKEQLA